MPASSTSNWLIPWTPLRAPAGRRAPASSGHSGIRFEHASRFERVQIANMSDCCSPKGYRQIFSEKNARGEAKRYRRKGLDGTSRRIADLLKERGVEGKSLLEVGGGIGAIQIELLKAGIARAINVELTPTYEEAADQLVREAGVADRVERKVTDFAEAVPNVEVADFVVMNPSVAGQPLKPFRMRPETVDPGIRRRAPGLAWQAVSRAKPGKRPAPPAPPAGCGSSSGPAGSSPPR